MNVNQIKKFYRDNPIAGLFVAANICANAACAWMFADFSTLLGSMFGLAGLGVAIALALALPIIGMSASTAVGKAAAIIMLTWIVFTIIDVGMSYVTTFGRFEYAKLNAEKATTLSSIHSNIAKTASATLDKCWTLKNCDSQARMETANASADKLANTDIKWTPHKMPYGEYIVPALIGGIAIISSLGSSIMGFIFGLGSTGRQKKPNLELAA